MTAARATLTWDDGRGGRSRMVDRPGRALLVTQAAWATLAGREPLLDGRPPYTPEEAQAALDAMLRSPFTRGMARRALATLERGA